MTITNQTGNMKSDIMGYYKNKDIENMNREKQEYLKEKLEQEYWEDLEQEHWEDLEQDRLKKLKELVKDNE